MKTPSTFLLVSAISFCLSLEEVTASCFSAKTASDGSCSDNVFSGSSISTSCSSDGSNSVTLSGTITVTTAFDGDSAEITALPCITMMGCYADYSRNLGKFCNYVTHSGGEECGSTGTYNVNDITQDLPEQTSSYSSYFGMATIKLLMNYDPDCASSDGSSYGQLMSVAAVPIVGLVAFAMHRRHKRRPLIVLNEEEGESNQEFVEMKDIEIYRTGAMV